MKKILTCLLVLSFFMDANQSVNAARNAQNIGNSLLQNEEPTTEQDDDNNGKPDYIEIDMSDYIVDSEFLLPTGLVPNNHSYDFTNNIATSITAKAKKIGNKALPILPYATAITGLGLYVLYAYNTSTTCDPDSTESCDPETQFSLIGAASAVTGSYLFGQMFGHPLLKKFTELQQNYLPKVWQSKGYITILDYKEKVDENFKNGKITKKKKIYFTNNWLNTKV
jgi:hypothetical protein